MALREIHIINVIRYEEQSPFYSLNLIQTDGTSYMADMNEYDYEVLKFQLELSKKGWSWDDINELTNLVRTAQYNDED